MLNMVPAHSEMLFHLCFTEVKRPGKGEKNHLLAGLGADVMVQGHDLDAGDLLDHRLHDWTGRFNQVGPYLLEQVSPLIVELQYSSASHHLLLTEEIMAKVDQAAAKKEEPVAVPNHTEKIKSQVLAKVGRPPRLHHVEVCRHHNGNYRVNIWEQPETTEDFAVSIGVHIRSSYYLKVSDTGEIIRSNPPLTKLGSSA